MKRIAYFFIGLMTMLPLTIVAAGDDVDAVDKGAKEDVEESIQVFQRMQSDPELSAPLNNAKAVFIIPDYATAALIVGGSGGEGVLVTRMNGEWGNPAFYDVGSISAGLQAGVSAGSIGMVIMTDAALEEFKDTNQFSLTSAAGLSILNWSTRAQGELGEGNDIIAWTDTEGLFGELSVALTDINWDEEENRGYYGEAVTPEQVIQGQISGPKDLKFSQR